VVHEGKYSVMLR